MSWVPVSRIANLDKVAQYLEALGVNDIESIPDGKEQDPDDPQLYVGNIEVQLSCGRVEKAAHAESATEPAVLAESAISNVSEALKAQGPPHSLSSPLSVSLIPSLLLMSDTDLIDYTSDDNTNPAPSKSGDGPKENKVTPMDVDKTTELPAPSSEKQAEGPGAHVTSYTESTRKHLATDALKLVPAKQKPDPLKARIPRVPRPDPSADHWQDGLIPLPNAPVHVMRRRVLPEEWSILGSRLIIPVYKDRSPSDAPRYTYRVAFRTIGEYCTYSDRISDGQGAEYPIGYETFERLIRDAKIGKTLAYVDLDRGLVRRVPKDERIPRTFWVSELEGIRDEGEAKRRMDDLEGRQRELTQQELLVQEATRSEAVLGRVNIARRQTAIEASKAQRAMKKRKVDNDY
ncbi:hypothetical protein GGF50DRAFT_68769 [Schizophyllum commune]